MSYLSRLGVAKYTAPDGTSSSFEFKRLSRSLSHKAAIMELPQQNIADVQDLGLTAPRFTLACLFTSYVNGADYDLAADAFVSQLSQQVTPQKPGLLAHPRWGNVPCMPLSIAQTEDFTENMGLSTVEVEFIRINPASYPLTSTNAAAGISGGLASLQTSAAADFGNGLSPANALDSAGCQGQLSVMASGLASQVSAISSNDPSFIQSLGAAVSSFTSGLSSQMSNASAICNSVIAMVQIPSVTQLCPVLLKVQSFSNVLANLVNTTVNLPKTVAQAWTHTLMFFGGMFGQLTAALSGTLTSRADAVNASLSIQGSMALVLAGVAADEASIPGFVAPVDIMNQLKDLAARASAMLMAQSFSLSAPHYLTLAADHTPLDLCYMIYGDISDTHLNNLYAWNDFQADQNFIVPIGFQVVYYA